MKLNKERRLLSQGQDPFLHHGTVDIIILNDDVLFQNLDRIKLVRSLSLCQHDLEDIWFPLWFQFVPQSQSHLPEGSLAENHQVVEILCPDDVLPFHVVRNHRVLFQYFALVV